MKITYGVTEGDSKPTGVQIFNNTCTQCGSEYCDVCVKNIPGTGGCCLHPPEDGIVTILQDYHYDEAGWAHELTHKFFNIYDEYDSLQRSQCGFTIHGRIWTYDVCAEHNHATEGDPNANPPTPIDTEAGWKRATRGAFGRYQYYSPDPYNFQNHINLPYN